MTFYKLIAIASLVILMTFNFGCAPSKNDKKTESTIENKEVATTTLAQDENVQPNSSPKKSSVINPIFPLDSLLGIWTIDPNGAHADFEFNKDYYFLVDQEGNGNKVYAVNGDSITIFFPDFITKGQIRKASNDTLSIAWDNQDVVNYVRWKQ